MNRCFHKVFILTTIFYNSKNEGRKFTPADTKESWHIIEYFVEIALLMYQLDDGNEEKQLE